MMGGFGVLSPADVKQSISFIDKLIVKFKNYFIYT